MEMREGGGTDCCIQSRLCRGWGTLGRGEAGAEEGGGWGGSRGHGG